MVERNVSWIEINFARDTKRRNFDLIQNFSLIELVLISLFGELIFVQVNDINSIDWKCRKPKRFDFHINCIYNLSQKFILILPTVKKVYKIEQKKTNDCQLLLKNTSNLSRLWLNFRLTSQSFDTINERVSEYTKLSFIFYIRQFSRRIQMNRTNETNIIPEMAKSIEDYNWPALVIIFNTNLKRQFLESVRFIVHRGAINT